MKALGAVAVLFLLVLAGLYVYGLTLKPDVRRIEVEVPVGVR